VSRLWRRRSAGACTSSVHTREIIVYATCALEIMASYFRRSKTTTTTTTMHASLCLCLSVSLSRQPHRCALPWQRRTRSPPQTDATAPTAHSPLRLCNLSLAQLLITMALAPSASLCPRLGGILSGFSDRERASTTAVVISAAGRLVTSILQYATTYQSASRILASQAASFSIIRLVNARGR